MMPNSAEEPGCDRLRGAGAGPVIRRYIGATRPAFFPASVLPLGVGSAWGWRSAGAFDPLIFALALIVVVLVHAGANVLNDVADDRIGTDRLNDDRIYPFTGGSRFIQNGVMTAAEMARWGAALLFVAVAIGLLIVALKGVTVLVLGAIGVGLGLAYSLPPVVLSARGLGELAVAAAFGMLPVLGGFWLQAGIVSGEAVLISLPMSFWVAAILLINEVPDAGADAAAGKHTLVVRFGVRASRWIYPAVQVAAVCTLLLAAAVDVIPWAGLIVPLGLLVPATMAARAIGHSRDTLRQGILWTLTIHGLGGLWLTGLAFLPA